MPPWLLVTVKDGGREVEREGGEGGRCVDICIVGFHKAILYLHLVFILFQVVPRDQSQVHIGGIKEHFLSESGDMTDGLW